MDIHPQTIATLSDEVIARAICESCEENPDHKGDCRGNDRRWQDYLECVPRFRAAITKYAPKG